MTGRSVADSTIKELEQLNLPLNGMVGIASDGGSNMSGKHQGAQALIRQVAPQAVFSHCAEHNLNLTFGDVMSLPVLRSCVAMLKTITKFVRKSAKRSFAFQEAISKIRVYYCRNCGGFIYNTKF